MKRKTLAEEKALRNWMDALPTLKCKPAGRKFYSDITALVRAVREDVIKEYKLETKVSYKCSECGAWHWKPAAIRGRK